MEQPLKSLKLDENQLKKLNSLGYKYLPNTLKDFFNENECKEVIKPPKTKTALDLYNEYSKDTIFTFIPGLDDILKDEIVSGNIFELCGESGSGKTQICFYLSVNVQLPMIFGGKNGESLYICSNYNFSKDRVKEIAKETINRLEKVNLNVGLSIDEILSKITHIQIEKYQELIAVVIYLKKLIKIKQIRLVIIDSLTVLAQQIDYKDRRKFLFTLLADLQKLADEYKFVVLLTNNVTLRNTTSTEISKIPALGENYFHRINSRVELKCLSNNYYKVSLSKSSNVKKEGYFSF